MAYIIADNIISPLGNTTAENLQAVLAGSSALTHHPAAELGVGEDFVASRMAELPGDDDLSHFERKVVASVKAAVAEVTGILKSDKTLLVLSTTKGDIEKLTAHTTADEVALGHTAQHIANYLGLSVKPVVVCNACISGLSALIMAQRLIDMHMYEHAIVCGTDDIGRFVVSGFQSLKALSAQACRPFDIERTGLNLGEAVATIVLSYRQQKACWRLAEGVMHNDAYHISAPSKTAEGQYRCLKQLLANNPFTPIDFINLHGTATLFNDQMESVAVERAGLSEVPANAYKGYYGHTLGAAGVLETVLSIHAAEEHTVVGTRGFEELGVSGKVNLSAKARQCKTRAFVKTLSGFGGCNAAALFTYESEVDRFSKFKMEIPNRPVPVHSVKITPEQFDIDEKVQQTCQGMTGDEWLVKLYKSKIGNYPKFYKMDPLSRLGFVASELLIQTEQREAKTPIEVDENRAIILFNQHSSLAADRKYLESIATEGEYYPSPSEFVYTLPNIVTGEIAIRNGYHGETAFYILPDRDEDMEMSIIFSSLIDSSIRSCIYGWLDYVDANHYEAYLFLANVKNIQNS